VTSDDPLDALIDTYCAAWREPDPERRRAMLAGVWADDATYTDPTVQLTGLRELVDHIGTVLARRPGARVVRTTEVDRHHHVARFGWRVIEADGSERPESLDLVELSPDGRLARVIGFFGPLTPG
jgi:hypothetical protein